MRGLFVLRAPFKMRTTTALLLRSPTFIQCLEVEVRYGANNQLIVELPRNNIFFLPGRR